MSIANRRINVLLFVLFIFPTFSFAGTCFYDLDPAPSQPGLATVEIIDNQFKLIFENANPDTLYTVWIDFRNRVSGNVSNDYPLGGIPRGVAPVFSTTTGVTSGMGLDANAVITDANGDAVLTQTLDYNLLDRGASPVVAEQLTMQGLNRVGGGWLRTYPVDSSATASLQVVDPNSGLPLIPRATAQGITVVVHPDHVSHGHTPGVGGVDHFPSFSGDFPSVCPLPDQRFNLSIGADSDRSPATGLEDSTVSGKVFVFLSPLFPSGRIERVEFFIDGNRIKREYRAPYDLAGTTNSLSKARPFNSRSLSNGLHRLKARIQFRDGSRQDQSASFFVSNRYDDSDDDDSDDDDD